MIAHTLRAACLVAGATVLAACSAGQPSTSSATAPGASSGSPISAVIDRALDTAQAKLASGNLDISNGDFRPRAAITPQGDLLIGGKPVPLSAAQRQEVLAYRARLVAIAQQGIAVGRQGATLGVNAASEAIAGALSGQSEQQIRQRVEAQTSGIRAAAAKICDGLPALMASQQKLAADVPAFRPYATTTQHDIDDCRNDATRAQTQQSTRDRIRGHIRSGVQGVTQSTGLASRRTSEAPGAAPAGSTGKH